MLYNTDFVMDFAMEVANRLFFFSETSGSTVDPVFRAFLHKTSWKLAPDVRPAAAWVVALAAAWVITLRAEL